MFVSDGFVEMGFSIRFRIFVYFYKSLYFLFQTVTVSVSGLGSVHLICLSWPASHWDYGGLGWRCVCLAIMPAPTDAKLKVRVSPGVAALHSNTPRGQHIYSRIYWIDLCMQVLQPLPYCQRQKTQKHLTESRRGKGDGEQKEHRGAWGTKGQQTRGALLLCLRVCYSMFLLLNIFLLWKCILNTHHIGILLYLPSLPVLLLLLHHRRPPLWHWPWERGHCCSAT